MLYRTLKPKSTEKPKRVFKPKAKNPRPKVKVYKKMVHYELLERTPSKILFEVLEKDQVLGFEVFKITKDNLKEIWKRLGTRKVDIAPIRPDYHTYMNSQLFGENGWYFKKLADALKKYGWLK